MDKQAFIDNFLVEHDTYVIGGVEKANANVKMFLSLIGCIYDLQQQIAQKDEFIDYLDNRLINLEQEVYK